MDGRPHYSSDLPEACSTCQELPILSYRFPVWLPTCFPKKNHSPNVFPTIPLTLEDSRVFHSTTYSPSTLQFYPLYYFALIPVLMFYIFVLTTNYKHHTEQDLQPPLSPLRSPCTAHPASEGIRAKMLLLWNRAVRLPPPSLLKFPKPALKSNATVFSLDSFSDSYHTI